MTQADRGKLRLMVVDDESDNLDLLYRTFRREFQVFKAESALKALQILDEEGEMGVIISDQRMPKMNGTEFLSRAAEQYPDTIRILLTGYTDVEDLVDAINAGKVFKYITKPWNPEELKRVVEQAAETYWVLKQRTYELQRALRRESIFNAVTTAIRESLDYRSMLQTIVETLGKTFAADACILYPVELSVDKSDAPPQLSSDRFSFLTDTIGEEPSIQTEVLYQALGDRQTQFMPPVEGSAAQLIVPLTYQQESLAVLALYQHTDTPPWSPEDIQLIKEVAAQAALAISQAKLYQRIQKQTEQMRAELAVARQIQTNLLRQELPTLDQVKIQACCHPAREVGGDFFEVYVHPQGDIWLGVGDVSGKGVPAALFMASAISVLRRELSQETPPEPHHVMRNLNSSLSDDLVGNNCFITMVLARYNPHTQELVYANAGHIYPIVWSKSLALVHGAESPPPEPNYLKVRGVPLGILPTWQAASGHLSLKSGDVLLLTSDGITEATVMNNNGSHSEGVMLGQDGLWHLLAQQQDVIDLSKILAYVQAHSKVQEDDQTILSLEVL